MRRARGEAGRNGENWDRKPAFLESRGDYNAGVESLRITIRLRICNCWVGTRIIDIIDAGDSDSVDRRSCKFDVSKLENLNKYSVLG